MIVCTREWKGMTAVVLMANLRTNSLGGGTGGHKHGEGDEGRRDSCDDVYYYIGERLKLERETENMCVC